jgi:paraquat-inducible protein B
MSSMSKPANSYVIGAFTVGAIALLIIAVIFFGGNALLIKDVDRFVIFFDSSLNGLDIGAPVKLQGVKIGTVTEILLEADAQKKKIYKPVVIEINRQTFVDRNGRPVAIRKEYGTDMDHNKTLIDAGLRARLETQSLLTGMLYVNFGFFPDEPVVLTGINYHNLEELPSLKTSIDELRSTADEIAKKVRTMPIDQIARDVADAMHEIRAITQSDELRESRIALAHTLAGLEKSVNILNGNLQPLLNNSNSLLLESRNMVKDMHKDMAPLLKSAETTLTTATVTLNNARSTLTSVEDAIGPESNMNEALVQLKDAARSIKELSDFLERHPEALISGKDK